jgi:nucleotidyltransferase/DNA polymerase involved in DNA repair
MARTVLHLELPGLHVAAAIELALARPDQAVVIHREDRVLDLAGVPHLARGQALRQAQRLAPAANFLPVGALGGAESYRAAWDLLVPIGPAIEPTAWHAGYVDVSGCLPRRGARAHLAALGRRLAEVTGQAPAQGVGANKLVARHASPWGRLVAPDETLAFLHQQPLRPDRGLTREMIELLDELGCHQWGDVALVPEARLRALFGVRGTVLGRWSQGLDPRPVRPRYPPPAETARALAEPEQRDDWLTTLGELATTLSARLRRRGEVATEVVLALSRRAGSGPGLCRAAWQTFRRRLARGIDGADRLNAIVLGLLPMDLDPLTLEEVRLTLRGLRQRGAVQAVLFADEREERRHLLDNALARVRTRYGPGGLGFVPEVAASRQRLAEGIWQSERA